MRKVHYLILLLLAFNSVKGQIKFSDQGNTDQPVASALLELESSSKGLLLPRVNDLNSIVNPTPGLIVFLSSESKLVHYTSGGWKVLTAIDTNSLFRRINAKLDAQNGQAQNLNIVDSIKVSGIYFGRGKGNSEVSIAIGDQALMNNEEYSEFGGNTAIGFQSMHKNILGHHNTSLGKSTLTRNLYGTSNTAVGHESLFFNEDGRENTAIGASSLLRNTTGSFNTAIGGRALGLMSIGNYNTATGFGALYGSNIGSYSGDYNSAFGYESLYQIDGGYGNAAFGSSSLRNNASGYFNVAMGFQAIQSNTEGFQNIGIGKDALYHNRTGSNNTASGYRALYSTFSGNNNTAMGYLSGSNLTGGSNNTAIGANAQFNNSVESYQLVIANEIYGKNVNDPEAPVLIGIATPDPTATLDINGTLRIRGGSPQVGKILVSDAFGNTTWSSPDTNSLSNRINQRALQTALRDTSRNLLSQLSAKIDTLNGRARNLHVLDNLIVNDIFIGKAGVNTNPSNNIAIGRNSLQSTIPDIHNRDGNFNIGIGENTLSRNTLGRFNIAFGFNALTHVMDGINNIGIGVATLENTVSGRFNIAIGDSAQFNNTGNDNISIGTMSLFYNTSGYDNTAIGFRSSYSNTTGFRNSSFGMLSNFRNQTGNLNTGIGFAANYSNVSGRNNVGIGAVSLRNNQSGSYNIAVGDSAAFTQISGNNNIAIGSKTVLPNTSDSYQLNIGNEIYGKYVGDPNHSVQLGIGKNNPDATLDINGDLKISGTNANLFIERGSNSLVGTVSLDETGAATVNNSKVTENSIIFLTSQNNSISGTLRVTNIIPGVSFSIQTNEGFTFENSKIGYLIIN